MPMVDGDWTIDRATGNIRYIGDDHTGASPSYATVIEFHRWLQAFADDEAFTGDDEHDIIDEEASDRAFDNSITLKTYAGGVTYNIDAGAAEHLYDGSITQSGGDERWDGIVNFGPANSHIQIIQDGDIIADDFWNYGHPAGTHDGAGDASVLTDSGESWTVDEWVGYTIKNITDGSQALITANTATTITGELEGGTDNDWDVSDTYHIAVPINGDSVQGISHRFMIKTRSDGVDIDRRRLLGTSRRFFNTYHEFPIFQTSLGNNVLALSDSNDINNNTAVATVAGWTGITNTEGLRLIDINNDSTNEEYYSEWNRDAQTINQFYERMKWLTRDSSTSTLQGINAERFRGLTHSMGYDNETGGAPATNDAWVYGEELAFDNIAGGPFQVGEAIHGPGTPPNWKGRILGGELTVAGTMIVDLESGTLTDGETFTGQTSSATADINDITPPTAPTTTAGEVRFYAIDDDGTEGNIYVQRTKGVAPVENTRIYDNAVVTQFLDVDENAGSTPVTERKVSTPFIGVSTGTALIGAYGIGMEAADTSSSDQFFDLGNNPISPPNNVTFTVSGLVSGEDYVLVTNDGPGVDLTQMATDTTLSGAAEVSVSINPAPGIPSDTPSSAGTIGGIRIERDDGLYSLHRYTAVDFGTDTFTIPSHDFSTNNATSPANVFITYLDLLATATSESFQYVYSSDRTHFIRVRDGGGTPIKTAEATGVMGTSGGSVTVNRISDT